jgi:hypothetical protein
MFRKLRERSDRKPCARSSAWTRSETACTAPIFPRTLLSKWTTFLEFSIRAYEKITFFSCLFSLFFGLLNQHQNFINNMFIILYALSISVLFYVFNFEIKKALNIELQLEEFFVFMIVNFQPSKKRMCVNLSDLIYLSGTI